MLLLAIVLFTQRATRPWEVGDGLGRRLLPTKPTLLLLLLPATGLLLPLL
jgi:hypothetical protein